MRDKDLYAQILGVHAPWKVTDVELALDGGEVRVLVKHAGKQLQCPCCQQSAPGYDTRTRRWRHLDTCQYRTILVVEMPRVQCAEHGVKQIEAPWAEAGSGFTALYESLVIDWLKEASIAAVARQLNLSWDEVDGIMSRAVQRGLARRSTEAAPRTGIDETSFQKRHEYVTVVSDLDTSEVLYLADNRTKDSINGYFEQLTDEQLVSIEVVAMDMWLPYLNAARRYVPDAEEKIVFDRFHVARHIGAAVDQVRRAEHKELHSRGDDRLKGSRYLWLQTPEKMSVKRWRGRFAELRNSALRTARAWALKEMAAGLWEYKTRRGAHRGWKRW